jgi:hypothetical protein
MCFIFDEGFHRNNINVAEYIKSGLLDTATFAAKSEPKNWFELVRKEDIDDLMSTFSTTGLRYIASDGCSLFMREAVDAMENETFQLYLKYHFATCERKDLSGITSHASIFLRNNHKKEVKQNCNTTNTKLKKHTPERANNQPRKKRRGRPPPPHQISKTYPSKRFTVLFNP